MGMQQQVVSLEEAFARAQRGNLVYAEILARKVLEKDPNHMGAINLLGFAAARAGLIGPALTIFRRAHEAVPQAGIGATVAKLEELLPGWQARRTAAKVQERYLLIKAWGFGFCSDLGSLLGSLLLAELTGRIPVVHWGPNSLYSDGTPGDCFRHYFEPLNDVTLDDLRDVAKRGVFPNKWNGTDLGAEEHNKMRGADARVAGLYFLDRDEPVAVFDFNCNIVDIASWIPEGNPYYGLSVGAIYRALWAKYLKPSARVSERVARFAAEWPAGPVLSVHVRDGDHRYEQFELLDVNAQYFTIIDRMLAATDASIYLMTDTIGVVDAFRARYGQRVFMTDAQRTPADDGIHYRPGTDKIQLGVDILSDVLLAIRGDRFVGNGRSNPSCTVWQLKDWAPGTAELIVPSFHEERNVFLYDF